MSSRDRFEEIIGEIKELLNEAIDLVPEGFARCRAQSYWYPHITTALDDDHEYMGRSMCTMQDTLEEFDEEEEDEEDADA